jgi:DNA topoisomerase II
VPQNSPDSQFAAGQLLTSSNYDDKEQKVTGGRNGFGAKLTNIFSREFEISTGSSRLRKVYTQRFYDNMQRKDEPTIKSDPSARDFTCIKFKPDLKLFKMRELDDDIVALFTKRAYDMAGCTDKRVKVWLNGKKLEVNNFADYVDLYLKNEETKTLPKITQAKSDRWEVFCSLSDGAFQ